MAYPLPEYDFKQMLLSLVPDAAWTGQLNLLLLGDPILLGLGLRDCIHFLTGKPAPETLPLTTDQTKWVLNFRAELTIPETEQAIRRVRHLLFNPASPHHPAGDRVQDLTPSPRRYLQLDPYQLDPGWAAAEPPRARACPPPVSCVSTCVPKGLQAAADRAYPPGWHIDALKIPAKRGPIPFRVAVLDSGADVSHGSLSGVIKDGFSSNPGLLDKAGHGTHIASTICGKSWGTPSTTYPVHYVPAGICSGQLVDMYKIFSDTPLFGKHYVVDWMKYGQALGALHLQQQAAAAPPVVVNLSFGGPIASALEKDVINSVGKAIFVAAAGNHQPNDSWTRVLFPAGYVECISVGAYRRYIESAAPDAPIRWEGNNDLSNSDHRIGNRPPVDLYAPGRNILGALPLVSSYSMPLCDYLSGTSMATAIVTGLLAHRVSNIPSTAYRADAITVCGKFPLLGDPIIGRRYIKDAAPFLVA